MKPASADKLTLTASGRPALEAYSQACGQEPSIVRTSKLRKGIALYGWNTGSNKQLDIAPAKELVLLIHMSGAKKVRLLVNGQLQSRTSKPGYISLIPRGQSICLQGCPNTEFVTLLLPTDAPAPREPNPWFQLLGLSECLFARKDDYVLATVKTFIRAFTTPPKEDLRYFSQLFDSLVYHLAQIASEDEKSSSENSANLRKGSTPVDFEATLHYIESHLSERLTLKNLSSQARVSRSLFAREFTSILGVPPHQFILSRRIERAKSLLRQGALSVTEIAYETGFSNQSHFSTAFKAITGTTPTKFSKQVV